MQLRSGDLCQIINKFSNILLEFSCKITEYFEKYPMIEANLQWIHLTVV